MVMRIAMSRMIQVKATDLRCTLSLFLCEAKHLRFGGSTWQLHLGEHASVAVERLADTFFDRVQLHFAFDARDTFFYSDYQQPLLVAAYLVADDLRPAQAVVAVENFPRLILAHFPVQDRRASDDGNCVVGDETPKGHSLTIWQFERAETLPCLHVEGLDILLCCEVQIVWFSTCKMTQISA